MGHLDHGLKGVLLQRGSHCYHLLERDLDLCQIPTLAAVRSLRGTDSIL